MVGWAAIFLGVVLGVIISWIATKVRGAFRRRRKG